MSVHIGFASLILALLASSWCSAEERTCQQDQVVILARAQSMNEAFARADGKAIVDMMYPVIVRATGGPARYVSVAQRALKEMAAEGAAFSGFKFGHFTKTYHDGKRSLCFLPKESHITIKGNEIRTVGYLVAIYDPVESQQWTFLDSDAFRKNPTLLKQLFPGLPADLVPPPAFSERVQ
jgi:hypothetical protein